jgi:hypothetical protein
LYNIASANGTFVAVGELGTILTSTDGTNWITRSSGTAFNLHDCAYGAGKYIAIGEFGTVLTSTDLVAWTPQFAGTFNHLNAIIYANSQFIAVGDEGTIVTSPDGIIWTTRASGSWQLFDITYAAGTYVVVGGNIATASSVVDWNWSHHHFSRCSSLDGAQSSRQPILFGNLWAGNVCRCRRRQWIRVCDLDLNGCDNLDAGQQFTAFNVFAYKNCLRSR